MSYLDDWSKVIDEQSKIRQKEQDEWNDKIREEMPEAIKNLKTNSNKNLLNMMFQFYGTAYDRTETELRQEFLEAVKVEVLRRMQVQVEPFDFNSIILVGTKVRNKLDNTYKLPSDKPLTVRTSGKGWLYFNTEDLAPNSYRGPYAPQCFDLWIES